MNIIKRVYCMLECGYDVRVNTKTIMCNLDLWFYGRLALPTLSRLLVKGRATQD